MAKHLDECDSRFGNLGCTCGAEAEELREQLSTALGKLDEMTKSRDGLAAICAQSMPHARLKELQDRLDTYRRVNASMWAALGLTEHDDSWMGEKAIKDLQGRLGSLQEAYDSATRHADNGWNYLTKAVEALYAISSDGRESGATTIADKALHDLPNCGVYNDTVVETGRRKSDG